MATEPVKADQINAAFQGMTHLPVVRQVGLLVGLAACIALSIYVVLWARTPDYTVLFHQVSARDTADIVNVLQQQNIPFKVDTDNGLILVDAKKVHQAHIALAAQELSHSAGDSFDLNEKNQRFGMSNTNSNLGIGLFNRQLEYKHRVETELASNIENILSPIVGSNKVRAQVVASMEFPQMEMTRKNSDSDLPAVRDGQRVEEQRSSQGSGRTSGAHGTTRNQTIADQKSHTRHTINNELDRSIVNRHESPEMIKRLSVAVIIDHKMVQDAKGRLVSTPYSPAQLARFTTLAKEAVGFDALRGDSVNVVNAAFSSPPPKSFFDQPWVWTAGKQVLGGLLVVLVLFGVLRPVMRNLAQVPDPRQASTGGGDGLEEDQVTLSGGRSRHIPKSNKYESDLETAKAMVIQEPKRVAQVVKQWVNEGVS